MKIRNLIYQISFTSILSALVFIATVFISIPYAGGAGYFNLSDALILFSCAYFGPTVGLLSGIIGCSLGDLCNWYARFLVDGTPEGEVFSEEFGQYINPVAEEKRFLGELKDIRKITDSFDLVMFPVDGRKLGSGLDY